MVKMVRRAVGFICEGATERLIVESKNFQQLLASLSITCVAPVIDAKGNGNLLPHNIEAFRSTLIAKGAEKIVVLTDLDEDQCITLTKNRITHRPNQLIVVAVKKIEAWFLADTPTLSQVLRQNVEFPLPEQEADPFQTIRSLMVSHTGRAVPTKTLLAKRFINHGFSVGNAANHAECLSAKYLLGKLYALA
jgi:hypothetical protein